MVLEVAIFIHMNTKYIVLLEQAFGNNTQNYCNNNNGQETYWLLQ